MKHQPKVEMDTGAPTPRQVKQKLLGAAIKLLSTAGKEGATARAICSEVGVSAPAIYHHYGDLASLHLAAINETFRQVALCYRRSAKKYGALEGIRNAWSLLMHFARSEPRMCRIVIEQAIAGDPPQAVINTLKKVSIDLGKLEAEGLLSCNADFATELLWIGAIGAACQVSAERRLNAGLYPEVLESTLSAILNAIIVPRQNEETHKGALKTLSSPPLG